MKKILFTLAIIMSIVSCTSVDSGFESPIISWGGATNMNETLPEGMHFGINYLWDDTPQYEIREQTLTVSDTYFDNNDMQLPVDVTVYFRPIKGKTNFLHKEVGPDYVAVKLNPIIRGALAKVIPQYTAQDLNKNSRAEAEAKLKEILTLECATIYTDIARVQFTKVGIPTKVAQLAEQTAVQIGKNDLAEKMEAEQVSLAKAKVAAAQGNYDSGILNAKTKDLLSQPKMLELMSLENERIMWEGFGKTGNSPFGTNNIFGNSNPALLLNRK